MTEKGRAFENVRAQVCVVRSLTDQMHRAQTESEKKYFDSKLKADTQRLIRLEAEARRHMDGMKPEMYIFCCLYYIHALSMNTAAEMMDRSVRQCARYKRSIENE